MKFMALILFTLIVQILSAVDIIDTDDDYSTRYTVYANKFHKALGAVTTARAMRGGVLMCSKKNDKENIVEITVENNRYSLTETDSENLDKYVDAGADIEYIFKVIYDRVDSSKPIKSSRRTKTILESVGKLTIDPSSKFHFSFLDNNMTLNFELVNPGETFSFYDLPPDTKDISEEDEETWKVEIPNYVRFWENNNANEKMNCALQVYSL